jgi:hypothetical protein
MKKGSAGRRRRRRSIIDQIIRFKNRNFSPKRMWAAKLVGKSERVTTLAARREIKKGKGHTQQRSDG